MERTTAFYPTAPRVEWFFNESKVSHLSLNSANAASTFAKLDAKSYQGYLASLTEYRRYVLELDGIMHDRALIRRHEEKGKKEVVVEETLTKVSEQAWDNQNRVGPMQVTRDDKPTGRQLKTLSSSTTIEQLGGARYGVGPPQKTTTTTKVLVVKRAAKTAVQPQLSAMKAEKRTAKAALRVAKVDAQVTILHGKKDMAASIAQKKVDAIKAAQEIKVHAPLHKIEERAANSALKRAKAVRFGSADIVTNITPDDGWRVVTRRKGERTISQTFTESAPGSSAVSTWTSTHDPAVPPIRGMVKLAQRPSAVRTT